MADLVDLGTSVVTIPAGKTFIHVLRSVAAALGSRVSMSFDDVDDLRLAVDEAAARLLPLARTGEITMSVSHAADGLDLVLSVDGDDLPWPEPAWESSLTWKILTALTERVRFERTDGAAVIRMFKRTSIGVRRA